MRQWVVAGAVGVVVQVQTVGVVVETAAVVPLLLILARWCEQLV